MPSHIWSTLVNRTVTLTSPVTPTPRHLVIAITDSGIGIPAEALKHLLGEFQQADNGTTRQYEGHRFRVGDQSQAGTATRGDLTVTSTLGVGSTFTLILPFHYRVEAKMPVSHEKDE